MSNKEKNKIHSSFSSLISVSPTCLACRFVSSVKERNNYIPLAHFSHYQDDLYCATEDPEHFISKYLLFCKYIKKTGDFNHMGKK